MRNKASYIQKFYSRIAPAYDVFFGDMLAHYRKQAHELALSDPCRDVLEIGIGTGLSLPLYPPDIRLTGIDLSYGMLKHAKAKTEQEAYACVQDLLVMDACQLAFAPNSFDTIIVSFILGLVPDTKAALDEMLRVLKPGGHIIITNHMASESGIFSYAEKLARPFASRMGMSTDLHYSYIIDWARSQQVEHVKTSDPSHGGFIRTVKLRKPA